MAATSTRPTETINSFRGSALEKLDSEFNDLLDQMKSYVLKLSRKSVVEVAMYTRKVRPIQPLDPRDFGVRHVTIPRYAKRQRIAMWIKKLCEPPGSSTSSRKNRNMYAQVLLAMLKRELIEEPFSQQPEPGLLPTMPPYMSIYVDGSTPHKLSDQEDEVASDTPSWLRGELESASDTFPDDLLVEKKHTKRLSSTKRSPYKSHREEDNSQNGLTSSSRRRSVDENSEQKQSPYHRISGGKIRYEPVYLREILNTDSGYPSSTPTPISKTNGENSGYLSHSRGSPSFNAEQEEQLIRRVHNDRELEVRTKLAEAKYHEDKLKLQQQHDISVQKILDRKNCELEEVKSRSRNKMTDMEARLKKQDRRIVQQAKEIEQLKEQRDKQLMEMKNIAQEKGTTIQNNFEKKLHDKIAQYEQEKFEMQKKHTKDLQEVMEETNDRVQKMEKENNEQIESLNNIIRNLEGETQKLSEECEALQIDKIELEQKKVELQTELRATKSEHDDIQESLKRAEKEMEVSVKNHAVDLQQIKKESMSDIDIAQKENDQVVSKMSDTIDNLKNQVSELQQAIKETEFQKEKELHELVTSHRQEKADLEHSYEEKIRSVEDDLRKVTIDSSGKISDMEIALREKSNELERCLASGREKSEDTERAFGEFKRQMEENAKKMYENTKEQMEKVEQDLEKSKISREKQAQEFTRQLESEKNLHEKLVAELKISFEQEKTYIIREHQQERETLTREHEREREMYSEKYRSKLQDLENQSRNKSSRDSKVIAELQQVNCGLREELMEKESLYKQQLVELGMLREEEKQTFKRQEEAQAAKSRSEFEQQRLQLQRQHSAEMEQLLDKTNNRFKQMEEDYTVRSKKTQETMDALREEIQTLKNERVNFHNTQEKRFKASAKKHEEEKASLKNHHATVVKTLERDIERQTTTIKQMGKQSKDNELNLQEKVSKLQFEYEEKIRGLLPADIKKELEDTIQSLRQQVSILQSRANVLQEELDATNTLTSTWDLSRFDKENSS